MTGENLDSSVENADTKVGRLIAKYGLDGMAADMEERWTRDDEHSKSIREIEEDFNKAVLRQVLEDSGTQPFDSELDTIYRVINGEQTTMTEDIEVRERLSEQSVDADSLADDLVSHQTIYNFLTKQRKAEYRSTKDPRDRLHHSNESIQKIKNRLTAVAQTNVRSLENSGLLTLGEFDVMGEVYVYCQNCNSRYSFSELIDREGCECASG